MPNYEDVIEFLDQHPGIHTYGEVARGIGMPSGDASQAVGSMMRAIHNRDLHDYCVRVVNAVTRRHGCDQHEQQ